MTTKTKKNPKTIKRKTLRLFRNIVKVLSPPPKLTVSEWADQYRRLSSESSAEPGQWRTDRAPYQKEIMDSVSDSEVEKVVLMCSSQVGKTEIILNILGYHIDYDPAPIMVVMPTVDLAKAFSKKRLATMIRDTPAISGKISDSKSRDGDNTILEKGYPGGYVVMVGANSPTGLSSRPIRILLADEVDRFPASAGDEGDPLSLAEKRTTTFHNKKKVFVSTPTEKETSRIEAEFETSTKEEWNLSCPMCGRYQPLAWSQIRFEDVTMQCKYCKEYGFADSKLDDVQQILNYWNYYAESVVEAYCKAYNVRYIPNEYTSMTNEEWKDIIRKVVDKPEEWIVFIESQKNGIGKYLADMIFKVHNSK